MEPAKVQTWSCSYLEEPPEGSPLRIMHVLAPGKASSPAAHERPLAPREGSLSPLGLGVTPSPFAPLLPNMKGAELGRARTLQVVLAEEILSATRMSRRFGKPEGSFCPLHCSCA